MDLVLSVVFSFVIGIFVTYASFMIWVDYADKKAEEEQRIEDGINWKYFGQTKLK